jgi:hypothetical protein
MTWRPGIATRTHPIPRFFIGAEGGETLPLWDNIPFSVLPAAFLHEIFAPLKRSRAHQPLLRWQLFCARTRKAASVIAVAESIEKS